MIALMLLPPVLVALLLATTADVASHHAAPWRARRRQVEEGTRPGVHELKNVNRWPAEPASPGPVSGPADAAKFRAAFAGMCEGVMAPRKLERLADEVLAAADEAKVDPFLLGALAYRASRCNPRMKTQFGLGLLQLQPRMMIADVRGERLRYRVREGDEWAERTRALPRGALMPALLMQSAHNLRVGAAWLGMWQEQHPAIDEAFPGSVPHRTAVAHFGWGDVVRGTGGEDRAMVARRRLIERYLERKPAARMSSLGIPVVSPLEGVPRVAPSGPGEDREEGARAHRGLDIDATTGESVRAIADGVVSFAGYDLPGRVRPQVVPPEELTGRRPALGPGGLFVCLKHIPRVFSCYMHLSSYRVHVRDQLKAGDVLGEAGRSGTKSSGSHLHLEIHVNGDAIDPAPVLGPDLVIPPHETVAREIALDLQKHRLKRERRARWKAHVAERKAVAAAAHPTATQRKRVGR